jgi:hypothetical protein
MRQPLNLGNTYMGQPYFPIPMYCFLNLCFRIHLILLCHVYQNMYKRANYRYYYKMVEL